MLEQATDLVSFGSEANTDVYKIRPVEAIKEWSRGNE